MRLLQQDYPPPATVIELGSAPGDQIAALAALGYEATSVDLGASEDAWSSGGQGRFRRLLDEAGVEHVVWDLENVPYPLPDASFDAVLMTEVFEHLREYPVRSIAEVRRILRPNGRLYFTTPNAAYVLNRLRLLTGRTVHTPLSDWIDGVPHARHAREYTFDEIDELMRRASLTVISRQSRHFHLDSGRQSIPARAAKSALDRIARVRRTARPNDRRRGGASRLMHPGRSQRLSVPESHAAADGFQSAGLQTQASRCTPQRQSPVSF
ncbi:MAG: class I SAM-dependent methyltransferase [Actinomycetota bacterium]|nr:class I SAM-dependent methyltransferase [Actinomycetota bacterium]